MVLWRPTGPFRTNTQKRCPFHHRGLECKSRKSRDTRSNRQIRPWSTKWAGQRLTDFCQENALVIANTLFQQHKRRLYTGTSPDGQYWNQIDYILCSQRWRSSVQLVKTRLGADCGSNHELLIAKFRLKLKKVGKTTRPLRCDLNHVPYDYTVEVANKFKGLDMIDSVWRTMDWGSWHVQEAVIKTSPPKKKLKKTKWLSEETLQIVEKREAKGKGEKKDIYIWIQSSKEQQGERKKGFLSDQCKETEENNRIGKTKDLFKKIRDTKGACHAKMGTIKNRNGRDRTETEVARIHRRTIQKTSSWSRSLWWCDHPLRATHTGMWCQVGLRKHYYEQSEWRWWNSSWAISNPERWCCESAALNVSANLENSAVATGLEKVSFHSNPKERQCQRMFKLPHNCTHLIC